MCGIAGIINLDKAPADRHILEAMVGAQRHRGPDDAGFFVRDFAGLGHARLSIIDLSGNAHQPMPNEDSTLYVVHNGEIYNYIELKDELVSLGHKFRSRTDTEVILHAYEEWGEKCLDRFNGMWAFAILNLKNGSLFCSRDRFGVKPFYYYRDHHVFIFASEIKAILKHPAMRPKPDDDTIFDYLASGYGYMDISDRTFFKDVRQLKPGHFIKVYPVTGRISCEQYWNLEGGIKTGNDKEADVLREFYELFKDAVSLRLRSDVPVAVSLSGGLDSSSIACVMARLRGEMSFDTFSSCFEDAAYDERRFIKPVIDLTGARPNFIFSKPENVLDEIDNIIWHQDEPYSTLSILPQWYVMKYAGQKGIKVLLTGQGGDETLGGYHKYYLYLFADLIRSMRWKDAAREMEMYRSLGKGAPSAGAIFKILVSHMAPDALKRMLNAGRFWAAPSYLNRDFAAARSGRISAEKKFGSILNNDLYNGLKISPLPSLLHIDDRSSMAHSVESRSPFLDYRLVEFLFSLGPEYKIRNGYTKYLLREAMKGVLPEEVRTRRDKMGFTTPLDTWLKTVLKDVVFGILSSREFGKRPYFNQKRALKAFQDFTEGRPGVDHYTIWSWVNLELWCRKFIDA